jgi:hypothetical protein
MNTLLFRLYSMLGRYIFDSMRDRRDILALQSLAPLSTRYLPWSQLAMRPAGLAAVLNDIVINCRQCIVECGGGISTFYMARLIRQRGMPARLLTVEHDRHWADLLMRELQAEQLTDIASVVHAPLVRVPFGWDGSDGRDVWYDPEVLEPVVSRFRIDLLVVDGPPAYSRALRHARYPAVPYFRRFLSQDYTIILDDINRAGEQEIVRRWESVLGIRFSRRLIDGGIAIGQSRPSFTL